jgi:hypothetical protein
MAKITEKEAARLDEYYTNNTVDFNSGKQGFFARQKSTVVVLDDFTSRYVTAKAMATSCTPSELIADMVRKELATAQ